MRRRWPTKPKPKTKPRRKRTNGHAVKPPPQQVLNMSAREARRVITEITRSILG